VTYSFVAATEFTTNDVGESPKVLRAVTETQKPELTDEELAFEAAREGSDGPSFTALLARHQDRVWRICYRLMGNADDASDAAQEVFVRLFQLRGKFAGRSRYTTWVHGIAIRTCLMMRRARGRRRRHEMAVAAATSPDAQGQAEAMLDVYRMLETVDEEDRALLILKYAEGYSHDDLAEMFELSVSACKMRIARARQRLQERFPEHNFGRDEP
jgi:RNA polymerase sigma-70 factor (ECF subfamily)